MQEAMKHVVVVDRSGTAFNAANFQYLHISEASGEYMASEIAKERRGRCKNENQGFVHRSQNILYLYILNLR